ncbi:MAG: ADP-forming succinate--CoA ligase subunit beta [Candidatus Bathyarchaeia archaeon]
MKLLEYEAKKILKKHGVPIPRGGLAINPVEAREVSKTLKPPFVVKAQVPVAGRGKAGGILFVGSTAEVEKAAETLLNSKIKGILVRSVWVEERVYTQKELYFGMTVDRLNKSYVIVGATEGGMDIEDVAEKMPEKILRFPVDPLYGFQSYHARQMAKRMGYFGNKLLTLAKIFHGIYKTGIECDAELIETNPLAETSEGNFVAVDARIIIDDNALFRHPELKERPQDGEFSPEEIEAAKNGLVYIKLDGNIGVIGNGAGLVMATLDTIHLYGGKPANFLDIGGGAPPEKIVTALRIVLSNTNVKTLVVNIVGGITRCDEVAEGIIQAKEKLRIEKPMVVRLVGANEEEGKRMLTEAGIHVLASMEEAAQQVVEIAKKFEKNGNTSWG